MTEVVWYIAISGLSCLVPLLIWWLTVQQTSIANKQREIKELQKEVRKLEENLAYTKNQIDAIYKQLAHRTEYAKLKYQLLIDQIADLNNFLKAHTQFIPRRNNVSRDFPTMSTYDDDPPTGIF